MNQSATRLWRTVAVKLPERAGRHRNSCGVQINQARIPHCNVQMVRSGLNVHCCRSWLGIASGWHLVHCQHVRPRWQPGPVAVTLCNTRDGSAIDLKTEAEIPSEVWHPVDSQVTRRNMTRPEVIIRRRTSLRTSADADCACKSKNQKNDARKAVSWFHSKHYTCEPRVGQQIALNGLTIGHNASEIAVSLGHCVQEWKNSDLNLPEVEFEF